PQPGFHGSYQVVHVAYRGPDCAWHRYSHFASRLDPGVEAGRNGPQTDLRGGRMPDPDRHFCHGVEPWERGPVVFQEFPGIYDVQNGLVTREGLLMAVVLT